MSGRPRFAQATPGPTNPASAASGQATDRTSNVCQCGSRFGLKSRKFYLVATLPASVFDIDRTQFNKGAEVQVGVIATNGLSSLIVTARDETFESRRDGLAELGA